jgi:hypothetical protein
MIFPYAEKAKYQKQPNYFTCGDRIPPDSGHQLCNISLWMTYPVHIILGLKIESNLIHNPFGPSIIMLLFSIV